MNKFTLKAGQAAAEAAVQQVQAENKEKKRRRPASWSAKFTKALAEVSDALQGTSDERIGLEIADYRRTKKK